jgi:hypothetical protein
VPEHRISPFDHPQRIVTALTYDLPIGKGRALNVNSKALDAVVGGWHLNSVYLYQIGAPLVWANGSTTSPGDYVFYGGAGSLPASYNNQETAITSSGTVLPAFNSGLFATSSSNTFEYHVRTFSSTFPNIRQAPFNEWDPSILKAFSFTERAYLQLRFEFFNVLNHPNFSAPASLSATAATFGEITSVANRPRTIQLGARFVF